MATEQKSRYQPLRRQVFVAPKVQGRLLLRIVGYCLFSSSVTSALYLGARSFESDQFNLALVVGPLLLSLVITIPLVMYDAAIMSNGLVGLFSRVHGVVRRVANRDRVSPIPVRGDEEWVEWIQDFNFMLATIQERPDSIQANREFTHQNDAGLEQTNLAIIANAEPEREAKSQASIDSSCEAFHSQPVDASIQNRDEPKDARC